MGVGKVKMLDPNERIAELERQIEELKSRLPAHSIPPAMMAQLDELEEALERAREELKTEG